MPATIATDARPTQVPGRQTSHPSHVPATDATRPPVASTPVVIVTNAHATNASANASVFIAACTIWREHQNPRARMGAGSFRTTTG